MHFNEINICAECATPLLWKSDLPARGALDDFSRHNGKKKSTKVSISSIHTIRKSHSTKNFSYPPHLVPYPLPIPLYLDAAIWMNVREHAASVMMDPHTPKAGDDAGNGPTSLLLRMATERIGEGKIEYASDGHRNRLAMMGGRGATRGKSRNRRYGGGGRSKRWYMSRGRCRSNTIPHSIALRDETPEL